MLRPSKGQYERGRLPSSDSYDRWRADPAAFIETVLHDPETGQPFVLLDAEREFLAHAFKLNDNGRLLFPEQVFAFP